MQASGPDFGKTAYGLLVGGSDWDEEVSLQIAIDIYTRSASYIMSLDGETVYQAEEGRGR